MTKIKKLTSSASGISSKTPQLQSASVTQVDRRWLNGFMAAGFHSGLISLSELKLEYMKAHRNAYGERMTEAQEQQLERRLTTLCQRR